MRIQTLIDFDLALSAVMTCNIAAHQARLRAAQLRYEAKTSPAPHKARLEQLAQHEDDMADIYEERGSQLMQQAQERAVVDGEARRAA